MEIATWPAGVSRLALGLMCLGGALGCGDDPAHGPDERDPDGLPRAETVVVEGDTVEVVGLYAWTVPMIRDSLRRYGGGTTLRSAACGVILRDSIGFPDASVFRFQDGRVVVTIIEHRDSANVRPRSFADAPGERRADWASAMEGADFETVAWVRETHLTPRLSRGEPPEGIDRESAERLRRFLASSNADADLAAAMSAIETDPDPEDRSVAVLLLLNFAERESAWLAAMRAMRDPDLGVAGEAVATLRVLRREAVRPIDWAPVQEDLRYLLAGTTLTFHVEVVQTLLDTGVDPALARAILSDGRVLLADAQARHEYVREPARALLARLSGRSPDTELTAWADWIRGLAGP